MAVNVQCGMIGLTDATSVPAAAVVSPNQRVKATLGPLATLADVIQFGGPSVVGNWVAPATRCTVGGIPAITVSSAGLAFKIVAGVLVPSGPLQMTSPDTRASGT